MAYLEVINPVAQTVENSVNPAPRLRDLSGHTIGLVWNIKAGGDVALERVSQLLGQKYKRVHFKNYVGSMGFLMRHCTPEDLDRIAQECDAAIGTTAD